MRARRRRGPRDALVGGAGATVALAQSYEADVRRAIDVAARHPVFASELPQDPGWTASGYDAQDRSGTWRVDVVGAAGAPIAWAQVRLAAERVLSWEGKLGLEGEAFAAAEAALLDFLRHDPEFVAFAGDVDERDRVWVGYEDWRDTWIVQPERGPEAPIVILSSEHAWARSLEDLWIVQNQVPSVVSVEDWRSRRGSDAIALAFDDALCMSRLVKRPKLRVGDTRVACALLGVDAARLTADLSAAGRSAGDLRVPGFQAPGQVAPRGGSIAPGMHDTTGRGGPAPGYGR